MFKSMGLFHLDFDPKKASAVDWFQLLHKKPFIAMLLLNVFDMVNYVLVIIMYAGICVVLWKDHRVFVGIAIGLSLTGMAVLFASHQAFPLLSLSKSYYSEMNISARNLYVYMGQNALYFNNPVIFGTGLFWSYKCLYISGLLISRNICVGRCMSGTAWYFISI